MNPQKGNILKSAFKPLPLMSNPHIQTLWTSLLRDNPRIVSSRERMNTLDGDFVDVDWFGEEDLPLVILIHGLASSAKTKYIQHMQIAFKKHGYSTLAVNLRGCSGSPNNKAETYHGGRTEDLDFIINAVHERFPARRLSAVGFSLGANILLKYLGEKKNHSPISAAVSISAPLLLQKSTESLSTGFSKFYGKILLDSIKKEQVKKIQHLVKSGFTDELKKMDQIRPLAQIKKISELDEYFTAPINGFKNANHYYFCNSAKPFLKEIQVPTLILHAKDDPFMPQTILPDANEISSSVRLEVSEFGGHVGFIGGTNIFKPQYWLEERVPQFINNPQSTKV